VLLDEAIEEALRDLRNAGLLRAPPAITGAQGPVLRVDGREAICLSSNNYLGLADDPALIAAASEAITREGLGAGASRLISGSMGSHAIAERRLAALVRADDAILFGSGYAANVAALDALLDERDVLFSDELNHASLIDGCRLSRAATHVYRHRDLDHLESLLRAHRAPARLAIIVTDAVFSMDGHRAPLAALRALADRHDAALYVDEAHGLGVLGPSGRGACAEEGVVPDLLLGTLGKALGTSGAFIAARRPVVELLRNRCRSFVFSTAPPPALAAAAARAADLAEAADDRRARLRAHAARLRARLRELDWNVPPGDAPIVPVLIGDPERTMALSAALLERGVFAHGIRPPTVPPGTSRIRLVPMATHQPEQIERALDAFAALRGRISP
jgi:8-amino-7-oxononanoate synthase